MGMEKWIIAGIAVLPFSLLVGFLFNVEDWELWALIITAMWWRFIGPASD